VNSILRKHKVPPPLVALVAYTLLILAVVLALKHLTLLAVPLFFSLVIAYLFNPLVRFVETRTPLRRPLIASILMVLLVFLLIFLIINLLPYVINQAERAATRLPELLQVFSQKAQVLSNYLTKNFPDYLGSVDIMERIERMINLMLTDLSKILGGIFTSLYNFLTMMVYLVFIPLFSYYIIKDYNQIRCSIMDLVPVRSRQRAMDKMRQMNRILSSFIRGQAIVVLILALLYSTGLSLIGLPFAILIGIFSGFGDIIPYVGTILGLMISIVIGFAHFQDVERLLLIVLVFALVKGFENWYFYPKIVGHEVGLHFVFVLMSIIIFGQLFGFWGLLVSIPAAAGFKVFIADLVAYYRSSNYYRQCDE
jgi:predicted PurR-regulated permease PerM